MHVAILRGVRDSGLHLAVRFIPRLPFSSSFWALIALVAAGTVIPTSCSRSPELDMNSVAGVYSLFPHRATMLILLPDGRASISMREEAGVIPFLEMLAEEQSGATEQPERYSFQEMEEKFGTTTGELADGTTTYSLNLPEELGIGEFVGSWKLLGQGRLEFAIENPMDRFDRSQLPAFEPGIFNIRIIDSDVLLVPVGTSTPKVREIRSDVWMRSPVSYPRVISIFRWALVQNDRFRADEPELLGK